MTPIIGLNGKCATMDHATRIEWRQYNTHMRHEGEICIARMDLVPALDASGTMDEGGCAAIGEFAANLTTHVMSMYYGSEDMHVGVVLLNSDNFHDGAECAYSRIVKCWGASLRPLRPSSLTRRRAPSSR